MRTFAIAILTAAAALPAGSDPAGFELWKSGNLHAFQQKLSPKINAQKVATQALASFANYNFRWLETLDEYFDYAPTPTPPQGRWKIYGIGLPDSILKKIYHNNAAHLLGWQTGEPTLLSASTLRTLVRDRGRRLLWRLERASGTSLMPFLASTALGADQCRTTVAHR